MSDSTAERLIEKYELDGFKKILADYFAQYEWITTYQARNLLDIARRDTKAILEMLGYNHEGRYWFKTRPRRLGKKPISPRPIVRVAEPPKETPVLKPAYFKPADLDHFSAEAQRIIQACSTRDSL